MSTRSGPEASPLTAGWAAATVLAFAVFVGGVVLLGHSADPQFVDSTRFHLVPEVLKNTGWLGMDLFVIGALAAAGVLLGSAALRSRHAGAESFVHGARVAGVTLLLACAAYAVLRGWGLGNPEVINPIY